MRRWAGSLLGCALIACLIAAGAGLGILGFNVEAPCMRPYAECAAHGHLGEAWGGLALLVLAAVFGLAGFACIVRVLKVLFSKKG
jgi:hypothetical protein